MNNKNLFQIFGIEKRRPFFNKRAQTEVGLEWIPNTIFTIAIIVMMLWLINSYLEVDLGESKPEVETVAARALYSDALSYCDNTRCWPGIIDYNKVKDSKTIQENFNESMHSRLKSPLASFKMTLTDLEGKEITEGHFNKIWYDRWKPLTWSDKYDETTKKIYVLLKQDGETKQAVLEMNLVMEVE